MKSNKFVIILFLLSFCVSYINAEVLLFSKAYELALKNASEIKSSIYLSQADEAKIDQEVSQLYPQVNLSAYYKKTKYETNPLKTESEQGLLNYTMTVNQSIYNAEVYSRINIQESKSKYSKSRVESEKGKLAKELSSAYLNVLKSKNKIELFESYLANTKSKLQELTKKYEMSLANKMDLLQMKVEYNSTLINLKKEKQLSDVLDLKLRQFIGAYEYELPRIDFNKTILDMLEAMTEKISHNKESLKIKQAKIALEISQEELEYAKDGHLPTVNLNLSYAKYDTDDPNIDAPYDNTKYFMFTLNLPIYGGGYVTSRIESAGLEYKAALEEVNRVRKEVEVELNEQLAYFEVSVSSVSMYKKALISAELYVKSIEEGYAHGLKSVLDLNEAKVKLNEVKYKYVENIYEIVNSYIELLMTTNNFEDIDLLDALVQ